MNLMMNVVDKNLGKFTKHVSSRVNSIKGS